MTKQVFWSVLLERNPVGACMSSLLDVAKHAGANSYRRITVPYARTDLTRNIIIDRFLKESSDPHDTLIMLDNDHAMPEDILERLAAHDLPIVGALAHRRGEPYDPIAFVADEKGAFHAMAEWKPGEVYVVDAVSPGAIAIQRRVFLHLEAEGFKRPWFRYVYTEDSMEMPSEDMYFYRICKAANVNRMAVDTALVIPHHTDGWITPESWYAYREDHPEAWKKPEPAAQEVAA